MNTLISRFYNVFDHEIIFVDCCMLTKCFCGARLGLKCNIIKYGDLLCSFEHLGYYVGTMLLRVPCWNPAP